ncbi:MAG: FHIPEP family type III secretion protein [Nitrospirales bacterium]|nr:FHIPEP family type III secretion protein [Nitrospirales bacterium]
MSGAPDTLPDLRGRIAGLLSQLRTLADPAGPGGALLAAMSEAEVGRNIVVIKDGARGLAKAVEKLQGQLHEALMQAEQLQPAQRPDIPGSDTYWLELKQALREATACSADAVLSVWLKSFAEAFVAWQLNVCERLTGDESLDAPELRDAKGTLRSVILALQSEDHAAALPGLALLVDEHPAGLPKSPLDDASRAAVLLVLGRIRLHDIGDNAGALTCFEQAREAAPEDGRVHAALAEYYRTKKDEARVRDLYRQAIAVSPARPGGYVGMGLWCEAQGWWEEAWDWYAQAVDVVLRRAASGDPLAELGKLLAPVSGALYLALAKAIGTTNPTAGLAAVEQAIKLGVNGDGKYPQRAAYHVKGEILEALQRPLDAAEAFFQAGQYYSWENDLEAARQMYERANGLDQQLGRNYWGWADVLQRASYVSTPPYVDKDKIGQSLAIWNLGAKVELPEGDYYWAYLTRAIIAQQLANLPGEDRWQCYWETVTFVEQALLLNPTRTLSWVILGQMHYALGNDLNALHATETALLCDPEDVSAIEERIFLLTNLHRFSEARALLAKRTNIGPAAPSLVAAIEAHLALYEASPNAAHQAYEAALASSEAAITPGATAPWVRIDRAVLLRLVGRTNEAQQAYKELWRKFDEQDVDNQLAYAWVALMIGEYDVAHNILASRSGDRISGLCNIERYLGFYRLLRGECVPARDHFDRAIELANSGRELDAWLIGDFEGAEVLQMLTGRPHAEQAREMLAQCKTSAINRRAALQAPISPLQEVQWLIAAMEASNEKVGWGWIGVHATDARLKLETRCWREAEEIYRRLQGYPGRFYTAQHGLEQALYKLVGKEHSTAVPLGAPRVAADYENLNITESALPEDRTRLADIHNKRANLERRRRPTRLFGQAGMQRLPAVVPIAIEAAANLKSLLQGNDANLEPEFAQHLKDLRWGLQDLLGFEVPSVRVRINEAELPDGTYVIMIREIPLVSGNIVLTRGLCNETVDRLTLLNVKGEEAINPVNGSECSWVGQSDWQKVKDAGLEIWSPAAYIVLHLSAVIRKNSAELVDIQAVGDLLKDKVEEQYSKILSAKGGLSRFTSVIQALLNEEAPIKELPSICDCYLDNLNLPTYEIPEEIRCLEAVRKDILGNTHDTPIYRIGQNLISLIAQGIQRDGEAAVLALEPEPTQNALTAVRNEVTNLLPTSRNPVLFVEEWRMRPFVRKLVELEFPHLAVLSRREAIAPDSRPVLTIIEV